MAKKLLIITILLVTSFSLMAQWTCETIDPEFDDAIKIAYTQENNGAQLMISDYLLLGTNQFGGYFKFSSIGDAAENYISRMLLFYLYDVYGIDRSDLTENEIEIKSHLLWFDSVSNGPGNIPMILVTDEKHYCEDDYCSVYSFEISFKIGESYKRYRNSNMIEMFPLPKDEIIASYKYDWDKRLGYYNVEWPSKEFWKDFKAASSVKFRIKYNENSDYQYYEFNMSGSAKAFNYATANHKVLWLEDWIERLEAWGEKIEEKRFKEEKLEEVKRQKEEEQEKVELQKELATLTPPHELTFESTERILWLGYPNFYLYPKSDWVLCDSVDLESEGFYDYDSILNILGLCPCHTFVYDILQDYSFEYFQKDLDWDLNGIQIRGKDSSEILIPFDEISQNNWNGKQFCASWDEWGTASCIHCYGNEVTDSLMKYQVSWTQKPLKMIITEKDRTKNYIVKDWNVDKVWQQGEWRYYIWNYNILSDDGKEHNVSFWREIEDPKSWCADCPLWTTNIGQYLLFDHWKIPSNVFFRHTELEEEDYLKIIK